MGTIKTTNIEPIADNGTVTLGSSGDTFTVPSGVTVAGAIGSMFVVLIVPIILQHYSVCLLLG